MTYIICARLVQLGRPVIIMYISDLDTIFFNDIINLQNNETLANLCMYVEERLFECLKAKTYKSSSHMSLKIRI